jgi:perosamine synthetase
VTAPYEIPSSRVVIRPDEITRLTAVLADILTSGVLSDGPWTQELEARIALAAGRHDAVATSSGTSALEIALRILDVEGEEVLVPTNTNFATAQAALNAGGVVRFYDGGLYPDLTSIDAVASAGTRVLLLVHIGGYIAPDIEDIVRWCEERDVVLVEDVAHAHGSSRGGRPAGSFGHAAAFSFYETKVVTTGEGGAIVTDDEDMVRMGRVYRRQGLDRATDTHVVHGNTWRISEIEAAIGSLQLEVLPADRDHRSRAIRRYYELLGDHPLLQVPALEDDHLLSGYKCILTLSRPELRERLWTSMAEKGVEMDREVYRVPLHRQPVFADLDPGPDRPHADRFAAEQLCLPMWRGIPDTVVDQVVDHLRATLDDLAGAS